MECVLFRAVTQREYDDIIKQGNCFRCIEKSLEVKQFAISEECGHYYGKEIVMRLDRVPYILIKVVLQKQDFCKDILRLDDCNAVSVDLHDLSEFNKAIISVDQINLN